MTLNRLGTTIRLNAASRHLWKWKCQAHRAILLLHPTCTLVKSLKKTLLWNEVFLLAFQRVQEQVQWKWLASINRSKWTRSPSVRSKASLIAFNDLKVRRTLPMISYKLNSVLDRNPWHITLQSAVAMVIVQDITVLYIPALLRTIKLNGSYYLSVLIYSCIILSTRCLAWCWMSAKAFRDTKNYFMRIYFNSSRSTVASPACWKNIYTMHSSISIND